MGIIRFEEELQEEIYTALRINKWRNILLDDEIEDIILNPTLEKLQKIVNINNNLQISKVKAILTFLKNSGKDVSINVDRVITKRYNEISGGKGKTDIVLTPKDTTKPLATIDDVAALKSENESIKTENDAIKSELAEMKAMMAELLEAKNAEKQESTEPVVEETVELKPTGNKPGRPPGTKKK